MKVFSAYHASLFLLREECKQPKRYATCMGHLQLPIVSYGQFRQGEFVLDDQEHSGPPVTTDKATITTVVHANPHLILCEVADCHMEHVKRHLQMNEYVSCADVWVPFNLNEASGCKIYSFAISLRKEIKSNLFSRIWLPGMRSGFSIMCYMFEESSCPEVTYIGQQTTSDLP